MKRKCKKWTDADYKVLEEFNDLSDKELSEKLQRTLVAVRKKRANCGFFRPFAEKIKSNKNFFTAWTAKEKNIILNNLDKSDKELSVLIGRSAGACRHQRVALGFKKQRGRKLGTVINDTSKYRLSRLRDEREKEIMQLDEGKKTFILEKIGRVNLDLIIPKPKPIEKIIEKAAKEVKEVKVEKPKKPKYELSPERRRYEIPKEFTSQFTLWNKNSFADLFL